MDLAINLWRLMNSRRYTFFSATLKLTAGFLIGIMVLAITFSSLIYSTAGKEFEARYEAFKGRLVTSGALPSNFDFESVRERRSKEAHNAVILSLVYANLVIFIFGGLASYWLARKSLRPIEIIQESQARFTSDASHELRTPLTVMKSEMEVLLRDKSAEIGDYREVIKSNIEEVDRLSKLSTTLLKIANLDDANIEKERLDMVSTVTYVVRALSLPKERLKLSLPKDSIYIYANRESITDLLFILLENAEKYSPPNSQISVKVAKKTTKVEISIANEGEGIHPDELHNIFQRFYRLDSSHQRTKTSGHGLGLSLAKRIVQIHNGEISATSGINKTTVFTIKLPIRK